MNVNTIKNAIIGSISKYKGQQITETLLVQIQDDLYDLAKPIGLRGVVSIEYVDENGREFLLDHEHWVLLNLFFLLCLRWTNTLVVNDLHEAYTLTVSDITKRLGNTFYKQFGNIIIYVKDNKVCIKKSLTNKLGVL